jgi:PPOX class probable F420-dependent enzyme
MTPSEAREFVTKNHHAVLATYRRDGLVQMSPVAAGVDGQGRVIVSTTSGAAKTANLRRDPKAALLAFTERFFGPWAIVWGTVEIVELPAAMPLLEDYYRQVSGEHPNWDEYREAMVKERRVMLQITISKAGPAPVG